MFAIPTICLVTDRRRLSPQAKTTSDELIALEGAIEAAAAAGIDIVQIRERDLEAATLTSFVRRVVRRLEHRQTRVVVNDRLDVALTAQAHGVHLRADGPPMARVRVSVPGDWIVGRSVHSTSEVSASDAREAASAPDAQAAVDYFIFGTMFATASKGAGAPSQPLAALTEAVRLTSAPVWAIGGITPVTAIDCLVAGARGIAAIGAFLDGGSAAAVVGARVAAMRRAVAANFGKQVQ